MSVSFEVRKPAMKNRLSSPACPAGSKVSSLATQGPNVKLAERSRIKPVLPDRILAQRKGRIVHESRCDLSRLSAMLPRSAI